jgi:hypothetical protein
VVADLETHAAIFDEHAPIARAAIAAAPDVVIDPFAVYEKEGDALL